MPSVWFHQSDSSVTGMYLLRSDVVPDERAKSFTRPGEATFFLAGQHLLDVGA